MCFTRTPSSNSMLILVDIAAWRAGRRLHERIGVYDGGGISEGSVALEHVVGIISEEEEGSVVVSSPKRKRAVFISEEEEGSVVATRGASAKLFGDPRWLGRKGSRLRGERAGLVWGG